MLCSTCCSYIQGHIWYRVVFNLDGGHRNDQGASGGTGDFLNTLSHATTIWHIFVGVNGAGAQCWAIDLSAARWSVQSTNVSCSVCHCTVFVARHFAARVRNHRLYVGQVKKLFVTSEHNFCISEHSSKWITQNWKITRIPSVRTSAENKVVETRMRSFVCRMFLTVEFLHLCTSHLRRVVQVCKTHMGDVNNSFCHSYIFTDTVFEFSETVHTLCGRGGSNK